MKRHEVARHVDQFVLSGVAFLPENVPEVGEQLHLLMEDGRVTTLSVHVNRFLRAIAFYFGTDVSALRHRYGPAIGRKQLIPLPFTGDWVMVPLKVRNPIGRQPVYGWFVAQHICRMEPAAPQQTRVELNGKHVVTVLHSFHFCQAQMRHVRLVRDYYAEIHYARRLPLVMEPGIPYDV
ncbi:MAG: hypothetical protein A6D91_09420 [Bacillaceae bacterium G1]|nr:MAG: hypothetical protein A6D91_09420 [Bacillaceae bacterium G1]